MSQIMLPGDANPSGNVHGGVIMKLVDSAAGVAALRHVRGRVVTARIDSMSFLQPVYVGDLVTLKASVNAVGRTSLEVGVRVESENLLSGEVRHVSSAYLVFVALDARGRPRPVPPLLVETAEEKRRQAEAELRRAHRQRGEEAVQAMREGRVADEPYSALARLRSWRKPGAPCLVVGHRGAAGLAPENTFPSFELALAQGADAVETDVHLTRDGVPVLLHDETVDRTTNGHGAVADLTLAEIRSLDASGRFHASHAGTRVPTLDDFLAWAQGRTRIVVELKGTGNPDLVPHVVRVVREQRLLGETLLISFDHAALKQARELCPEALTGALYVARPADPIALARACGASSLCPQWPFATPDTVAGAHQAGLAVSVWTCNDRPQIEHALSAGVDAVTSDFPERVRALLP
jgi:glycerophosphoryl diester phosphodiesterase/acyl-CoA hydrolase